MSLKVLLIQPPVEDFFFTPVRSYPLGLLSLATVLKQAGFSVSIYNCQERKRTRILPLPSHFNYLKRYYQPNRSPFCLFSRYQRFGEDSGNIEQEILRFKPDIVGISANFTAYLGTSFETARIVRRILPGAAIVLGGRAASLNPEFVLSEPSLDFVLGGEAELSFLELCKGLAKARLSRIKGLCYRDKQGKLHISAQQPIIADLDSLPVCDHSFIAADSFCFQGVLSASLLASRGCNMGCSFCAIREPLRWRSPQMVLQEMEQCYLLGIRHFNFEDDNINYHPHFELLLDMIRERFGSSVSVSFMNGLLSKNLNNRLRQKLIKAGLTHLDLSMVSSQDIFRKQLRRTDEPESIFELAEFMANKNITVTVHYISGFPGQNYEQAIEDIRLLARQRVLLGASIFYPLAREGVLPDTYQFYRSSCAYYDQDIDRDRIFTLFYFSRIVNFIKQLIDKEKIDNNFEQYLKERLKPSFFNKRLDRIMLGVYLLRMMLQQGRVFRVEEKRSGAGYYYDFKEEVFVKPQDVREFFNGLIVRSVCGRTAVLNQS